MRFEATAIDGAILIQPQAQDDGRGAFARVYDETLFAAQGLPTHWPQHNISENKRRGTLRGMHYQTTPHEEPKIVSCLRGAAFDVALDLRPASPTYKKWAGFELSAANRRAFYIPAGCAHGFLTLVDDTALHYLMGAAYSAEHATGARWNDPTFDIKWPFAPTVISPRDADWPDYKS